jgi:hypothetical protein
MSELSHLLAGSISDAKVTEAPLQRSATGYGRKLPTPYMLRVGTRWHRVYVMNYGNAGSTYVLIGGVVHFLSPGAELIVEKVRDGGTVGDAKAGIMTWPEWMQKSEGL